MKKLSIIVPLYNVENCVSLITHSIMNQADTALERVEVIAVDDGSSDNSLDVFVSHLYDVDVITLRQENMGPGAARNAGIHVATGEYIMFADSDDFLLSDALENILTVLEKESPDVLFGKYLRYLPKSGFLKEVVYDVQLSQETHARTEYILGSLPESSWNVWRYISRREMIVGQNILFESNMYSEDDPWVIALLESAESISFLRDPFYAYHYRRPLSIMNSINPKRIIDLNTVVYDLVNKYQNRDGIVTPLIWQSFFYINEYCKFKHPEKKILLDSYRAVLPLYKLSGYWLHRFSSRCRHEFIFHALSWCLFSVKQVRRLWRRFYDREA